MRRASTTSKEDEKYLTTQALEWFDGVKSGFWSWLLDEEQGYKHTTAIASFILGALVVYIVPDAFTYAGVAAGAFIILAFLVGCLVPIALLVEWALRKVWGR
jgi:VIT1/CCC1 family predicted Fe2+/Mn2+ transporter